MSDAKNISKLRAIAPMLFDVFVPVLIYYILHFSGLDDRLAFVIGGIISGIIALFDIIRKRKFKNFSLLVFLMFGVSIAMSFLIKDTRLILIKPSVYIEAGAIYCLFTTFGRPLVLDGIKPFATEGDAEKVILWDRAWQNSPVFKHRIKRANVMVGIALMAEGIARAIIVFSFPVSKAMLLANIPFVAVIVFFGLLGRFYISKTAGMAMDEQKLVR